MKLFTKEQKKKLLRNGQRAKNGAYGLDFVPVVKLFTPTAQCTWLLTEIDPDNPNIAFGLCDLGLGFPEIGYVSIAELEDLKNHIPLPVERDRWIVLDKTLKEYSQQARLAGRIVA